MVEFRAKKKEELRRLRNEHRFLERLSSQKMEFLLEEEVRPLRLQMKDKLREAMLAAESLRKMKIKLCEDIQRYQKFQRCLNNAQQAITTEEKPILPVEGWWVRFPDGAPPFFFAPLAPEEIAAEANPLGPEFVPDLSAASMVGTLVGWNLYRELSPRGATGGLQRMRLTKRLNCSINTGLWVAKEYERQLRPVLVAARSSDWTRNDEVFTQTLQEIDSGTRVMVHAISGAVSVHYLFLDRTVEWKLPDGRRKIGYCMKIIDSKAGRLCRDAEGPREDFHWVNEGWARFMVTEVQDNAIDVVYEHCAAYQSESETTELITHWARFILLWEGFLFPSNLVSSA